MKLEITTVIGCPNGCKICPQDLLKSTYKGERRLGWILMDRLTMTVPRECELVWAGFSEPFLHFDCGKMVALCSARGYFQRIATTTVGFTDFHANDLKTANVHYLKVHVPDLTNFVYPADKWIESHNRFWNTGLQSDYDYVTMGEVPDQIRNYLYDLGIISIKTPHLLSRAGNVGERPTITGKLWCSQERWHYNILVPNGDVYLCCMDYGLKHKLGNLLEQPYSQIWDEAERLRLGDHSEMICSKCELAVSGRWYNPFGRPTR